MFAQNLCEEQKISRLGRCSLILGAEGEMEKGSPYSELKKCWGKLIGFFLHLFFPFLKRILLGYFRHKKDKLCNVQVPPTDFTNLTPEAFQIPWLGHLISLSFHESHIHPQFEESCRLLFCIFSWHYTMHLFLKELRVKPSLMNQINIWNLGPLAHHIAAWKVQGGNKRS